MIVNERPMLDNIPVVDYVPVVSAALPMTPGELCAYNEAVETHFQRLDRITRIIEEYERMD